jgi:UDP-N-acetyl-2-amino-2-deoxyglucuronate dehydrogenase
MEHLFGIIGTGAIAELHAAALTASPFGRLGACFDLDPARSAIFANTHGCASYSHIDEFLRHPGLEIVCICTPSGLHLEPALAAAAAGKHLVVEKPLEITVSRCDQIIAAAEKHGVLLSGIFPMRFSPSAAVLKRAVDRGRFGRIVLADTYVKWFRSQEYYSSSSWKGTWAMDGGGALMNQAIHAVDLLQWIAGPVAEVSAFADTLGHTGIEVEDTAAAVLRFSSGALGVIEASTSSYPGFYKRFEITGSAGSAVIVEDVFETWEFAEPWPGDEELRQRFSRHAVAGGGASDPNSISYAGHQRQLEQMMRAVEGREKPAVDGEQARRAVEIIEGIYRSSTSGSAVKLPLDAG